MKRGLAWLRRHGAAADVAAAVLLVCLALVEVWTMSDPGTSRWLLSLVALAMTVPFAWRRRWPLQVLIVVTAGLTLCTFAWDTPDKAVFPTVALVLAIYTVAAHCALRSALAALVLVSLPVFVHQVVVQHDFGDFVFIAVMMLSVWTAGRGVRASHIYAVEATTRATAAEGEADARTFAAVAEERLRIARELHDVVAHSVSVMTVQAGAERRVLADDDAARPALVSIEETGRQAMAEMRRLLGMLRAGHEPAPLSPQPGIDELGLLIDQVRAAGLPVDRRTEGKPQPLPAGEDLAAYRIVQEALTNTLRHAGPATATVTLRYQAAQFELEVADNGHGLKSPNASGHGLIGMRERVSLYGGQFQAGNRPGGGYLVRASLPFVPPGS